MTDKTFATAICCIDGRIQTPMHAWIKQQYNVDYVDTLTEPGVDGITDKDALERLRKKAVISHRAHGSKFIVVSGHHECAANPGPKEKHVPQIQQLISIINSWGLEVKVVGAWVNSEWQIEQV